MNKRNLTKLQVRAEVLAVIQRLSTLESSSREDQLKQIKRLKSISSQEYVLDCLLRELPKGNYEHLQIVAQLLLEFGDLDTLQKPLWNMIKDPNVSDEMKDTANAILRNLGDTSDPDLYLNYLKDPQELIDKETERMLKMASMNPEAQIDFLDFLFSLPSVEQLSLINSLKADYPGEYLTCIFLPALEARPDDEVYHSLIEALGGTRSVAAMEVLEELFEVTESEFEKKKIKKSLNLLKLAGVKKDCDLTEENSEFIKDTHIYKCFASPLDGIGNQGVIISRLRDNSDISLFSVVINDIQGVVDCFGFSQITNHDFERIIKKFQEGTNRIDIPVEYCKSRMVKAEKLNRKLRIPIPYEYTAWKVLVNDIDELSENIQEIVEKLKMEKLVDEIDKVYLLPDFYCWFIEDDDHPNITTFFKENLSHFVSQLENKTVNIIEIADYYDECITEKVDELFDDSWRKLYFDRLANETYLFKNSGLPEEAALVATAAWSLTKDSDIPLSENLFIRKLMQKSVAESLLRFQFKIDEDITNGKSIISQDKIDKYKQTLDQLYYLWQIDY
jgi:hypothetical protein